MDGLSEPEKWKTLDRHSDKPVVARSELTESAVSAVGLSLDPDWKPERHVNIVGWNDDLGAQKSAAQHLSVIQRCVIRQNGNAGSRNA